MSIPLYLAMTAAEFSNCARLPAFPAWMAVHFSPSGPGLSNCPASLPPGSLLILDDQLPWNGHREAEIFPRIAELLERNRACGLLLDFERAPMGQTLSLAEGLARRCMDGGWLVGMPPAYLGQSEAAVFLPPPPCYEAHPEVLRQWEGRPVWLEASPTAFTGAVTRAGVRLAPMDGPVPADGSFFSPALRCRYAAAPEPDGIRLTLFDTPETILEKLAGWQAQGVSLAVGGWRDFRPKG